MNKENKDQALAPVGSAPITLEREEKKEKKSKEKIKRPHNNKGAKQKKKGKTKDVLHFTSAVERSVIAELLQKKKKRASKDDEEVRRYKHELV